MGVQKKRVTPRQKMINLMYVVLMAMLALNVSSDVLKGFALVEESLSRTVENATRVNVALFENFQKELLKDSALVEPNYNKAREVRKMSDSLCSFVEELKLAIARKSDGAEADVHNLVHADDLEAASSVMLAPGTGRGQMLFDAINSFRTRIVRLAELDGARLRTIKDNLSTEVPERGKKMGKNWQEFMFEGMPTAAAVTMLTKLQNDIRMAEGEVLHSLAFAVGVKDTVDMGKGPEEAEEKPQPPVEPEKHHGRVGEIPVNELTAFVVPNAQTIVQGNKFTAEILMAAVDTEHKPTVYVGGRAISGSHFETTCSNVGDYTLSGYINMPNNKGEMVRRDFTQKYSVVAPAATVSADLMNVLYAGYDNPMSVSVPGVPSSRVSASLSGAGTLTHNGPGKFTVRPTTPGTTVSIVVSSESDGRSMQMGSFTYRVRKLPDPSAYLVIGGDHVFGGKISKKDLLSAPAVYAAIDDGLLNIPFTVHGFEMVFHDALGNVIPEVSNSGSITERQRNAIRQLGRGKRFYITNIKATGPDGINRTLKGAMQVIVN